MLPKFSDRTFSDMSNKWRLYTKADSVKWSASTHIIRETSIR